MTQGEIVLRDEGQQQIARPMSMEQIIDRITLIQRIMKDPAIMKEGVHYGPPNGKKSITSKRGGEDDKELRPVLLQPGAEKLLTTFRLAADFPDIQRIVGEDGGITYQVKCAITDQVTGMFICSELGTCSSYEEKYMWKRSYLQGEFNDAKETERRKKWQQKWSSGYKDGEEQINQVRVNPADVANTILAMACKRAKVRAARSAVAASDIFDVNTEDLPDDIKREFFGEEEDTPEQAEAKKKAASMEQRARAGQSSNTRSPQQQQDPSGNTIDRATVREIMQTIEQLTGFTAWDQTKQKNGWTKEAFSFLSQIGAKGKLNELSAPIGTAVLEALRQKLEDQIASQQASHT